MKGDIDTKKAIQTVSFYWVFMVGWRDTVQSLEIKEKRLSNLPLYFN